MTQFDLTADNLFSYGNAFIGRGRPVDEEQPRRRSFLVQADPMIEITNRQIRLQGKNVVDESAHAFQKHLHPDSRLEHAHGFPQLEASINMNRKDVFRTRNTIQRLRQNLRGLSLPGTIRPLHNEFARFNERLTDCYRCGRVLSFNDAFVRQSMTCHACDTEMGILNRNNRELIRQLQHITQGQ